MASREFRVSILNNRTSPLTCRSLHEVDAEDWKNPWQPYNSAGAGIINPGETKECVGIRLHHDGNIRVGSLGARTLSASCDTGGSHASGSLE